MPNFAMKYGIKQFYDDEISSSKIVVDKQL
jgi:hypothetical protein